MLTEYLVWPGTAHHAQQGPRSACSPKAGLSWDMLRVLLRTPQDLVIHNCSFQKCPVVSENTHTMNTQERSNGRDLFLQNVVGHSQWVWGRLRHEIPKEECKVRFRGRMLLRWVSSAEYQIK